MTRPPEVYALNRKIRALVDELDKLDRRRANVQAELDRLEAQHSMTGEHPFTPETKEAVA